MRDKAYYALKYLEKWAAELSEHSWAAGWICDNEYMLWECVDEGSRDYGMWGLKPEQIEELRQIATDADGWIYMDDTYEIRQVPMAEWLKMYSRWKEMKTKRGESGT